MIEQAYYSIDFSATSCLFEIRVNDIPVMSLSISGQVSTRIPINFAITKSGEQKVSVKILPLPNNTKLSPFAELKYDIKLYDVSNNTFTLEKSFKGYKSPQIDKEKIIPILTNTVVFEAKIAYQLRDYWTEGQNLKDIDDIDIKIRNTYIRLGKIISDGNYELFAKKMVNREYNMATAMYLKSQESNARINGLIHDFKNGFDIIDFAKDAVTILSAYGKKITLKNTKGEPALSFINKETGEQIMLDIEFYLPKNTTEFEII